MPGWASQLLPRADLGPGTDHLRTADARGWPFLAMKSIRASGETLVPMLQYSSDVEPPWERVIGGVQLPDRPGWTDHYDSQVRVLPLVPIWDGFMINTGIFAFGWALVRVSVWSLRYRASNGSNRSRAVLVTTAVVLGALTAVVSVVLTAVYAPPSTPRRVEVRRTWQNDSGHGWMFARREYGVLRTVHEVRYGWDGRLVLGDDLRAARDLVAPGFGMSFPQPSAGEVTGAQVSSAVHTFGFPFRAAGTSFVFVHARGDRGGGLTIDRAWRITSPAIHLAGDQSRHEDIVTIPLSPLWTGLVLDIAIGALAWLFLFGLLSSPWTFRRARRERLGLCIQCGYDLRGSYENGCPECGRGRDAE